MNELVTVSDNVYELQHPGTREWLKLRQSLLKVSDGGAIYDNVALLDYAFSHVVFPVKGPKLKLDNLSVKEADEWAALLPNFLRGDIDSISEKNRYRKPEAAEGSAGDAPGVPETSPG